MEVRLDGRSAIITGCQHGAGPRDGEGVRRVRRRCCDPGARPEVLAQAKQTVSATAQGGRVATFVCDVSKADDIQKTYDG